MKLNQMSVGMFALFFTMVSAFSQENGPPDLSFLAGSWAIYTPDGNLAGSSEISLEGWGAVLFEKRRIGEERPQPLWLVNSEEAGGWKQLFVGVNGLVREFKSRAGQTPWPLVLEGDVTLRDGSRVTFRLTIEHASDDESRRVLERTTDNGATWTPVLDYTYRRKTTGQADVPSASLHPRHTVHPVH